MKKRKTKTLGNTMSIEKDMQSLSESSLYYILCHEEYSYSLNNANVIFYFSVKPLDKPQNNYTCCQSQEGKERT